MSQLVNLKLNLFKYEGKPFADGVSVWIYKPKQAVPDGKYFLVESATKSIEKAAGENSVAAQYGSSIYVVSVNSANLGSSVIATDESTGKQYSWVLSPTQESLLPQYDEGREVLRRLLAKAITNKQILRKWFVERYRIVYHYSYAMSQPLSGGPFEVYQGFIFRPFVFKDGSAAVLLDPKFKFVPRETLRDYLERLAAHGYTAEDIQTLLVDEIVIDHCPIVECTLRNTPGSPCRLRGSGKRRQLVGLDFTRKPSATAFGDLIAYNRDTVCQNKGMIAQKMRDDAPIALIEFPGASRPYDYPLERLRRELKLNEVDRVGRLKVMEYVRPSMRKRLDLTKGFLHYVDQISFGRKELRLARDFATAGDENEPWQNFGTFDEPPLLFAGSKTSPDPIEGLEAHGPFDLKNEKVSTVKIALYCYSSKLSCKDLKRFYDDLVDGFQGRPSFKGLRALLHVKTPDYDDAIIKRNNAGIASNEVKPDVAIIIAPAVGIKRAKQYRPLKKKLSSEGIPCQFVIDDNILDVSSSKYAGLLKNVSLDVYAKIGGIAWILGNDVESGKCFIGMDSISRGSLIHTSIQVFNNRGEWLGGWTRSRPKEEYARLLSELLQKAVWRYSKSSEYPKEVIIHKEGFLWPNEKKVIDDTVTAKHRIVSVMKLGISRIYDVSSNSEFKAKRGTWSQIDDDEAILVTSGPPHQILGSQKPLTIKLHSEARTELLKETCREVFHLSLVYGGYTFAVTSKPITTHYASKATSMAATYGIEESEGLWGKAWFI